MDLDTMTIFLSYLEAEIWQKVDVGGGHFEIQDSAHSTMLLSS